MATTSKNLLTSSDDFVSLGKSANVDDRTKKPSVSAPVGGNGKQTKVFGTSKNGAPKKTQYPAVKNKNNKSRTRLDARMQQRKTEEQDGGDDDDKRDPEEDNVDPAKFSKFIRQPIEEEKLLAVCTFGDNDDDRRH
jgi:hypothetical protein